MRMPIEQHQQQKGNPQLDWNLLVRPWCIAVHVAWQLNCRVAWLASSRVGKAGHGVATLLNAGLKAHSHDWHNSSQNGWPGLG